MSPGEWETLLAPGLKALTITSYYDNEQNALILKKSTGETLAIDSKVLGNYNISGVLNKIHDWIYVNTFRLVDVGEGMLVPKRFMDEFGSICQEPKAFPWFKTDPNDWVIPVSEEPPPFVKGMAEAFAKHIDAYIAAVHSGLFDKPKSMFILDPDDHPLIIPPDEPPPKFEVVKTFLVLPSDPGWYGVISLPE